MLNKIKAFLSYYENSETLAKIGIIGSGIAGLAASIELASQNHEVILFEKNDQIGGRGRTLVEAGFVFDMGPSWYWMPDIFEEFFQNHGHSLTKDYDLKRLDPSYRMFFTEETIDAPASLDQIFEKFEEKEKGSSKFLSKFLKEAKYKYVVGMKEFVNRPSLSWVEYLDWSVIKSLFGLEMLKSIEKVINKGIIHPNLRSWLSFPVLFLGAKPSQTPALYSLMNYADMELGTWYPVGGMHQIFHSFYSLALKKSVKFHLNEPVHNIEIRDNKARGLRTNKSSYQFDYILSAADYHHTEHQLLDPQYRQYDAQYWNSRKLAPGALIYYVGTDILIPELLHHNLFFDADFKLHSEQIYDNPEWPASPLFYLCRSSATDPNVAPDGCENLFFLMPIAPGLIDEEAIREKYFDIMIQRVESKINRKIKEHIIFKKSYCTSNFINDYNSFKGNAYGLSNVLSQTAFWKPKMQHRTINNLFFAGQLTHPGPGLPPSMISGKIAAELIHQDSIKC